MLRLILVRHAKSAWDDPSLADIDRPLAERGIEASAWIGDTLAKEGWHADRVLCSPAQRARETLELAIRRAASGLRPTAVITSEEVYDRRDEDYLELIRTQVGARALMLVGHNPATEETATVLVGEGDPDAIAGLMERFATGAIAVIDFDVSNWSAIERGAGRLVAFRKPPKG